MKLLHFLVAISALLALPLQAQPLSAQPASQTAAPPPAAGPTGRPPKIPTTDFTKASRSYEMQLSPDGKLIGMRLRLGDGKVRLAVIDPDSRKAVASLELPADSQLQWFRWAGNQRMLVSLSQLGDWFGEEVRFTRLFVYDVPTLTLSYVGKNGIGIVGDDLLFVDPNGEYVLLAMQRDIYEYPSVWRFPLDGTAQKNGQKIEGQKSGVWSWYADSQGTVRMGIESLDWGSLKVWYRGKPGDPLKSIAKLSKDSREDDIWDVVWIIGGSDDGYVLKPDDSGKVVLRRFNYATRTLGETLYSAPETWDITDVTFGDDDKPSAIYYTDDYDRVVWIDPGMKTTQARLNKALGDKSISVTSKSRDSSRMIVWAGAENDPGAWYLYNAAKGTLNMLDAEKPRLLLEDLIKPRPVKYKARDGKEINAYLALPKGRDPRALPLIIMPHGGPYGVRDKLQFDTEVQFLANRGYAVLQPNYRGSGGYGDEFEELGRGQIGRQMQDDLDDAVAWAVAQGYADPKRVCMVGSSYGGYAAMWAVIRNPELYRCAASFAGVTDFNQQLRYDSRFFDRDGLRKFRRRIKGDDDKFNLDLVSPARQIARLTRPVLLAHGEKDTNVPFRQFKLMRDAAAKAGKPIELLTFAEEGHGFEKPENEAKWLDALDAFLAKHNPAD